MDHAATIEALRTLGLNELEARVYCHLVEHSPATGYRTAKGIGKPTANTYRALEALAGRGIVTRDDDSGRLFRAVPPDEVLNALERRFLEQRGRAAAGLASLGHAKVDQRVYPLATREQVLERLRKLLTAATRVVLLDATAASAEAVREELAFAVESGVRVVLRLDGDEEIPGVWMAPPRSPGGGGITAVSDARELLIAEGREEKVHYAVYTANPVLARAWHLRQVSEMLYAEIVRGLEEGLTTDDVEQAVERYQKLRAL